MNEEDLKQRYGKKNPFGVPEGYFDEFPEKMMNLIPKESDSPRTVDIGLWDRVKPWVYMAAMFVGLMFTARMFMGKYSQQAEQMPDDAESVYSISELPDEYIDPIVNQTMMDDYQLYEYLSDAHPTIYN